MVKITSFNCGIIMFPVGDEWVRRIHPVLYNLNKEWGMCRGNLGSIR